MEKFTTLLTLSGFLAALLGFFSLKSYSRNITLRKIARESRRRLFAEVLLLRKKRDSLDTYTPEYFHAFEQGGWRELKEIIKKMSYVEETIDSYLKEERYKDVIKLSAYLLDELKDEELIEARKMFGALRGLEGWKRQANEILIKISVTLSEAASNTKNIGIDRRNRDRQPTLKVAAELLELLRD